MKIRMTYEGGNVVVTNLRENAPLNLNSISPAFRAYVEGVRVVYEEHMRKLDSLHRDKTPKGHLEISLDMEDRNLT